MPHHVDTETVRHVADLARISVSDQELPAIAEHLAKILSYVDVLNDLDTDGVEPAAPTVVSPPTLRADVARAGWSPQKALENAPDEHQGFIRVPKVLDQGDA